MPRGTVDLFLGVDAGNSKTVALAASADGAIWGWGRAGCGDIYGASSAGAAITAIVDALGGALRAAGGERAASAAVFSLAGADWEEDFRFLQDQLCRRLPHTRCVVVNDAMGALRAGTDDGVGVAVVCGTGAATGARSRDGRMWHSSWWQEPQGSRELASKTLRAVYRSALGIDPNTALTAHVLRLFGASDVEVVLHTLTRREGRLRVPNAAVTAALVEEALGGDATARRIIQGHGAALGEYAVAAAYRVGMADEEFPLVVSGGVSRLAGPLLRDPLVARVREGCPSVYAVESRWEPAVGALLLAVEAGAGTIDRQFLQNMEASLPPAQLFAAADDV